MRTQSEAYWRREGKVSDEDIEHLYSSFLEEELPRSLDDLAIKVMKRRCQIEEEKVSREAEGQIYRPQEKYEVGQELVFSALNQARGKIISMRPGRNPKYGPFEVIGVQFESEQRVREFASNFSQPHSLNDAVETLLSESEATLSVEQLYALYGSYVRESLEATLAADPEFAHLEDRWFLRSLLPEVNVGHLNIAEAMIDMAQRPLATDELLREVGLSTKMGREVQQAALEAALKKDERFDSLGEPGARRWFLFSLEPAAAIAVPPHLRAAHPRPSHPHILGELAGFVKEIGDELDENPDVEDMGDLSAKLQESASFILNYAHWREGTMPLTREIRRLLSPHAGPRYPISFTEAGQMMPGWVWLENRYAWGLGDWYRRQEVPLGGTVILSRTDNPMVLAVSLDRRPRRGEWVREARALDGKLTFEMQRRAYTCRYDRYLLLHVAEQETIDKLAEAWTQEEKPLANLILDIVPELIKLSSQGVFQAKTLYAAVNLVRRSGALPIFVELTRRACFDPVGAGNWAYDPNLKDLLYGTEEEMRDRPLSQRADLFRDIVVTY